MRPSARGLAAGAGFGAAALVGVAVGLALSGSSACAGCGATALGLAAAAMLRCTGASGLSVEMMAITSPTGASSPASARRAATKPSCPASTSIVDLSVSTSKRISPEATASPRPLCHATISPVSCAMPSAGIITSAPSGRAAPWSEASAGGSDGVSAGAAWVRVPLSSAVSEISAMTLPTGTSAPASACTSGRKPSAGASTSIVALSVSTSKSASPDLTASPEDLSQLTILPVSCAIPRAGMMTSCGMDHLPAHQFAGVLGHGFGRGHGDVFQRGAERHGHIHRPHPQNRGIKVIKRLFIDPAGDFPGDPKALVAFIDDDHAAGFLGRFEQRGLVQRHNGARVDHLGLDAFLGEDFGGGLADLHHRRGADQGDIRAFTLDISLAEGNEEFLFGHRGLVVVHQLVFEDHDRVVIADRGLHQALGLVGRGGHRDLQAGDMRHQRVQRLAVLRGGAPGGPKVGA